MFKDQKKKDEKENVRTSSGRWWGCGQEVHDMEAKERVSGMGKYEM